MTKRDETNHTRSPGPRPQEPAIFIAAHMPDRKVSGNPQIWMSRAVAELFTILALFVAAWFWWKSASPPLANMDTITQEMKEAASYSAKAAIAAGIAASFQAVAVILTMILRKRT